MGQQPISPFAHELALDNDDMADGDRAESATASVGKAIEMCRRCGAADSFGFVGPKHSRNDVPDQVRRSSPYRTEISENSRPARTWNTEAIHWSILPLQS